MNSEEGKKEREEEREEVKHKIRREFIGCGGAAGGPSRAWRASGFTLSPASFFNFIFDFIFAMEHSIYTEQTCLWPR